MLLLSCHVLFHEAGRVRDLALFVDVVLNDIVSQDSLVSFDDLADRLDVEVVAVNLGAKSFRQDHSLSALLGAAARDSERSNSWGFSLDRDHDGGDNTVGSLRALFEVAADDVDGVPAASLDVFFILDVFLYKETSVEAGFGSINEVNTGLGVVVVELDVRREHRVGLLLELQQRSRREERTVRLWEVLVAPRRPIGIAVPVVLMLQENLADRVIHLAF